MLPRGAGAPYGGLVIGEAVQAYLATLPERVREPTNQELSDSWFAEFDETAHVSYEARTPTRLARLGAWLARRSR
jgi:hypothetical protein